MHINLSRYNTYSINDISPILHMNLVNYLETHSANNMQMCNLIINVLENFLTSHACSANFFYRELNQLLKIMRRLKTK